MQRIIYISAYGIGVFHWQKKQCIGRFYFDTNRDARIKFRHYLLTADNTSVNILVDLADEEFIRDTIPHVGAVDRNKIIRRTINRQYKKYNDYLHYALIGREKNARRDDVIRYSLLRNPQTLTPWLNILTDCKTSIRGIWSLPLLSEKLLSKAAISATNILLITQQQPNSLRQTFIRDGIFQSSRLTSFNPEDAAIGEFIFQQIESTVQFLSNQRLIEFDQTTEVHIICNNIDRITIQQFCTDTALYTFHYHHTEDIYHTVSGKPSTLNTCTEIYAFICAAISLPVSHYGNAELFKYYYEKISSKFIYAAGIFIFSFSALSSLSLFSSYQSLNQQTSILTQQSRQIQKQYTSTFKNLEPELASAEAMQSAVLLSRTIKSYKSLSPLKFMSDISVILNESGIHDLAISRLSWQQYQSNKLTRQNNYSDKPAIDYAKPQAIIQHAIIEGFIYSPQSDTSAASESINKFVLALRKHPLIIEVNSKPLGLKSEASSINSFSRVLQRQNNKDIPLIKKRFSIALLMQGNNPMAKP